MGTKLRLVVRVLSSSWFGEKSMGFLGTHFSVVSRRKGSETAKKRPRMPKRHKMGAKLHVGDNTFDFHASHTNIWPRCWGRKVWVFWVPIFQWSAVETVQKRLRNGRECPNGTKWCQSSMLGITLSISRFACQYLTTMLGAKIMGLLMSFLYGRPDT